VSAALSPDDDDLSADGSLPQLAGDWVRSLSSFEVRALTIFGPASAGEPLQRGLWAAHPVAYEAAAAALASSDVYGPAWRASNSPAMAWQNLADAATTPWSRALREYGILAIVRSDVPMPYGAGFEAIALVGRQLVRSEAFEIGWALNNAWPVIRDALIASRFGLTPRVREVLRVLAEGHTAKETAQLLGCKERTVHFHLSTIMQKLGADNRASAILRACMHGIL
jgi:DNA-binding NarL/FixJ family response regulator